MGSQLGEKRDLTCGNSFTGWDSESLLPNAAERFYAAGEERAVMSLPPGHGYPIAKNDSWLMTYMVMNHRARVDRAYIQYEVTVDTAPDMTPVKPVWLDVENCQSDPVYDVPGGADRGETHRRSYSWTVPEAGRIVAGGGHVHGGGQNLRAEAAGLLGPARLHVAAGVGRATPPVLPRAAGAARARADPHDRLPLGARRARCGGRAPGARLELRRFAASHPRDGDLPALPGARLVGDLGVRRPSGRLRAAADAEGPPQASVVHGPDRGAAERQGGQHRCPARAPRERSAAAARSPWATCSSTARTCR